MRRIFCHKLRNSTAYVEMLTLMDHEIRKYSYYHSMTFQNKDDMKYETCLDFVNVSCYIFYYVFYHIIFFFDQILYFFFSLYGIALNILKSNFRHKV